MRYAKWTLLALVALTIFGFFHYNLPQHDIVRIVGTENRRVDLGVNSIFYGAPDVGSATATNRDVSFIQTVLPDGKPMVYRNEDTGWGWPPYFKFDSSNLQTEAIALVSSAEAPKWVAMTHYGWRIEWLSIFPNAVAVDIVSGPEARIIPWASIVILTLIAAALLYLRAMWRQFRERSIDPVLEDVGEAWDDMEDRADAAGNRAKGAWARLRDRFRR